MWFESQHKNFFIVVFEDDSIAIDSERELSDRIDMGDTGTMDEVKGVYKVKGGKFYSVEPDYDSNRRINTDEEMPFRYSQTDLVIQRLGRKEVVGSVTYTDH